MPIIYEPEQVFNPRNSLAFGAFRALFELAIDFVADDTKGWSFYPGVALGGAALATGIPGLAATIYAVGDTVDFLFLHNPDGSDARIFLNGIAHASLDTYAAVTVWETLQVIGLIPGQVNRIDIVNNGPSSDPSATGIPWLAIGPVSIDGQGAWAQKAHWYMASVLYSYTIRDADGNRNTFAARIALGALTLADLQAWHDLTATELNAVTEGVIESSRVEVNFDLPGGLRTDPVAGSNNQEGGLMTFALDSGFSDGYRVPAWQNSKFNLKDIVVADADVEDWIELFTINTDINGKNVRFVSRAEELYSGLVRAVKSFRRK